MFCCVKSLVNFNKIITWFKMPKGLSKNIDDLGADLVKRCLIDRPFFLMANRIILKGILDGSRSLYRLTFGCLENFLTEDLYSCTQRSELHVILLL